MVRIEFLLKNKGTNKVLLTNVLHALNFGTNLVSAMALISKGLSIFLAESICKVRCHDNTMLAEGKRSGGLIRLNTMIPLSWVKEAIAHLTTAKNNIGSDQTLF